MPNLVDEPPYNGEKFWWVPLYNPESESCEVTVVKVGYKYMHLSNDVKIERVTGLAISNRHGYQGQCYVSKEEYETGQATTKAWEDLDRKIHHSNPPRGVTEDDIKQARALLRL